MAKKQYLMLGYPQVTIFPKKLLGKDKVRNSMKEITQQLKLADWDKFGSQVLRAFICTKLSNKNERNIERDK